MSLSKLTSANFDMAIGSGLTLVDFWAGWCMPCRMLAPVIEELARQYEGSIEVGKVDVDEENELAVRYGIMSIPTVILFNEGKEEKRFIGVQPIEAFKKELQGRSARATR